MSYEFAIVASDVSKTYHLFDQPRDRLKQIFFPNRKFYREFNALSDVTFSLPKGEVLGLIGRNGAGKSTLLQLVCGTLNPTKGKIQINGRIAALLELGAGFNPEFSGRENIFLYASVLGLTHDEISQKYESIVEFSGIRDFIEQPVKTYSSGMYVRLAFSIATSIDPDVLIVDEALSVGDGAFARKSFDRIMELREQGTTILFCSHMMFQIETLCTRAIWLENGRIVMDGDPAKVVVSYQSSLAETAIEEQEQNKATQEPISYIQGYARLEKVIISCDGKIGRKLKAISGTSTLSASIYFASDPSMPAPTIAVTIHGMDGGTIASTSTLRDGIDVVRNQAGQGWVEVRFEQLQLLKGTYNISAHLLCERSLHLYETAAFAALVDVEQAHHEQGIFSINRGWKTGVAKDNLFDFQTDFLTWLSHAARDIKVGEHITPPTDQLGEEARYKLLTRFGFNPVDKQDLSNWVRSTAPQWVPEWFTAQNIRDWLDLFKSTFGHETTEKYFQWKYRKTIHPGICLRSPDRKIIAFYGGMQRAVHNFGKPALAVQACDLMIHPNEQGVLSRNGPFMRCSSTFIERLIGDNRPYQLGYGIANTRAMHLGDKLGLYTRVDNIFEMTWPAHNSRFNLLATCRPIEYKTHQIDHLWAEMSSIFSQCIIGVRDSNWFEERYQQHPNIKYSIWLVTHRWNRKPQVAFVLREHEEHLELVDIVGAPQNFSYAVSFARQHAWNLRKKKVTAWITQSQLHHWNASKPESIDTGSCVQSPKVEDGHENLNCWWLMAGDTDFR